MATLQHNTAGIGGRNIHYLVGGSGAPLVLIHGGGGGINAWEPNLAELAEHYTIYAPDLPGFGQSQSIHERFRLNEYTEFIDDFTKALGLSSFSLIGHSLGGGIALSYALNSPHRIQRLVLVSSMFLGSEIALWARFLSSPRVFRWMGEGGYRFFRAMGRAAGRVCSRCRFSPPFTRVQMSVGQNIMSLRGQTNVLLDRLTELVMPTLVVWGEKDSIVPARQAYTAAGAIPDCRLRVFEGCGHHVQQQALAEFSDLVVTFLDEAPEREP